MKKLLLVALLTSTMLLARENCESKYTNPEYDQKSYFSTNYIKVTSIDNDILELTVSIPCGTKHFAAIYQIGGDWDGCNYIGEANLISHGSSQCSLGNNPIFYISNHLLKIDTEIEVPGFDGSYRFFRED